MTALLRGDRKREGSIGTCKTTMMDMPLSLNGLLERARWPSAKVEVNTGRPDRSLHRTTYGEVSRHASVVVTAVTFLLLGCEASALPVDPRANGDTEPSFERYSYTNEVGTRTYKVFVPAHLPRGKPAPLLVDLPGCGSDADEESRWSRFNDLAAARGMIVAYPEQDPNAHPGRCWNWYVPDNQERDRGEASIIAGITREVPSRWNTDAARTYVSGISAGGAMAVNMAATYPTCTPPRWSMRGANTRG